jgi:hypothetical protein
MMSPRKDSHHGSRDPSASPRTDTDDDDIDRPSLYHHKPQKRFDEFDRAKMEGTHILDALKLRSFEGSVSAGCSPCFLRFGMRSPCFHVLNGQILQLVLHHAHFLPVVHHHQEREGAGPPDNLVALSLLPAYP